MSVLRFVHARLCSYSNVRQQQQKKSIDGIVVTIRRSKVTTIVAVFFGFHAHIRIDTLL